MTTPSNSTINHWLQEDIIICKAILFLNMRQRLTTIKDVVVDIYELHSLKFLFL